MRKLMRYLLVVAIGFMLCGDAFATFTKESATVLSETKETTTKHNIPMLKKRKEALEKQIVNIQKQITAIDAVLVEAGKAGIN